MSVKSRVGSGATLEQLETGSQFLQKQFGTQFTLPRCAS